MASYQKMYYCKTCKKNVSVDSDNKCVACHGTQLKKSWSVRFRVVDLNGEKQKRLTGFETKKEAEKAYIDFMTNYKPFQTTPSNQSFIYDELLKEYFDTYSIENEESTIYEKRSVIDKFITPFFKERDIRSITKNELQNWQNYIWNLKNPKTNDKYSWNYLKKIRGVMYNFLEYQKVMHDIPNLLDNIKIPKKKELKKEMSFWELQEFNSFIKTVNNIMWKTLWYVFMFTGARFNEIRALSDNDIKDNKIYITKSMVGRKSLQNKDKRKNTKNSKIVIKQIPDLLLTQLNKYFNWKQENKISSEFLFGGDKPLTEDIKKAKVRYLNPHGFRHSYVSLLIHLGVSSKIIAELIGDNEIQVIETYGHLYNDAKNTAIELLNSKINNICV